MNLLFTGASGFLGNNIIPLLDNQYSIKTMGLSESDNLIKTLGFVAGEILAQV